MIRIALAQADFTVGAVDANLSRLSALRAEAAAAGASLLVTPELSLCGYPPDDLLLRQGFLRGCEDALSELLRQTQTPGPAMLVGHPHRDGRLLRNSLSWLQDGVLRARYDKQCLPNYAVFDEKRYFTPGQNPCVVTQAGHRFGLLICEDIWFDGPARQAAAAGAQTLIVVNASPYHQRKREERIQVLAERAREVALPILYLNLVGGQDDLVFDGQSMLVRADGSVHAVAAAFQEALLLVDYEPAEARFAACDWHVPTPLDESATIYAALVRATADYVRKNGFKQVLLGLSGGIDSALTLAIAVDALGPERVSAWSLPSRYTVALSNDEARRQCEWLGVRYGLLPIEAPFQAFIDTLAPAFIGRPADVTEENLQSRCRGVMLMALSNKFGGLLLSTGNKSEMAVGYATIYGDMCGGFAPLKDVYKTEVYALARYRNSVSQAIPEVVIERAPSAELRENQTDQDSLPPYDLLDAILFRFIELERSRQEIIAEGYEPAIVRRVADLVLRNEYKRRQAAPGPRVTTKAFGRDRRYPISSGYR